MAAKHPKLYVDKLVIPTYTVATLPSGEDTGTLAIATDATPPALCWFDGTNWIAADDGTTVA